MQSAQSEPGTPGIRLTARLYINQITEICQKIKPRLAD